MGTLGPARVVDIDPALLRKPSAAPCGPPTEEPPPAGKPALSGRELPDSEILYNGVPLQREFVDDEFMFDIFAEDRPENGDLVLDGGNVAWVAGEDLPVFDWDSESDEECDESDEERSVDYPSTPEQSVDSDAFEDDWRARERRFCESDGNETEDGVENLYDIRAGDSDDGDCFDYDA